MNIETKPLSVKTETHLSCPPMLQTVLEVQFVGTHGREGSTWGKRGRSARRMKSRCQERGGWGVCVGAGVTFVSSVGWEGRVWGSSRLRVTSLAWRLAPSPFSHQPVHARKVSPEVASAVSRRHLLCVDHHWVALLVTEVRKCQRSD